MKCSSCWTVDMGVDGLIIIILRIGDCICWVFMVILAVTGSNSIRYRSRGVAKLVQLFGFGHPLQAPGLSRRTYR